MPCIRCGGCCYTGVVLREGDEDIIEKYPDLVTYDSAGRPVIEPVDGRCKAQEGNDCTLIDNQPVGCKPRPKRCVNPDKE